MSKYIFISGDGDFSAMEAEEKFNMKDIYKEMKDNNVTKITKTLSYSEDDFYEDCDEEFTDEISFELVEFGDVDPKFEEFIKDNLCDYDALKAIDIVRVED